MCVLLGIALRAAADPASPSGPLPENGIHVGQVKIYDSRELTLMLDSLSAQLQSKSLSFINPQALAGALGNLQGFQSSDFSQSIFANGAVGAGAATVFANAATGGAAPAAAATVPTTTPATAATSPAVTINVSPSLSASTAPTSASTTTSAAPSTVALGPQAPALPTLQTPPTFTPNFGPNASDVLSDEVNLTYQISNLSLLLNRSLTDRLHRGEPRLQAVAGFDIDIEPDVYAKDAAAVVEITATMINQPRQCSSQRLSLIALMPEEGSHNAATLSQKANAFGAAIAASVFSVGYSVQGRSQLFYLYRDMDTVSFQGAPQSRGSVQFGWQFRPVLGQRTLTPGLRHLIAVLGLPCSDVATGRAGDDGAEEPRMAIHVTTSWRAYDASSRATSKSRGFWPPWGRALPPSTSIDQPEVSVFPTQEAQQGLRASISRIRWLPTDAGNGVVVIEGKNFFPGTTVRFGNKTFSTSAEGLVIKSDQEIEVSMPLAVAVLGGALSGRYGAAVPLQRTASDDGSADPKFSIQKSSFYAEGNALYQVDADLLLDQQVTDAEFAQLEHPILLINGVPLLGPPQPFLTRDPARPRFWTLTAFVPTAAMTDGGAVLTVTFPFAGPRWTASMPHFNTTLSVTRLGGGDNARLLIRATDPGDFLCDGWELQLNDDLRFKLLGDLAPIPARGGLRCIDHRRQTLSLEIPTKTLAPYHKILLTSRDHAPLIGDIPPDKPKTPQPEVKKGSVAEVTQGDVPVVTFKGKHLDAITKVMFDGEPLEIVAKTEESISILLSRPVTRTTRAQVALELLSPDNDPVIAIVNVGPPKNPPAPTRKGK